MDEENGQNNENEQYYGNPEDLDNDEGIDGDENIEIQNPNDDDDNMESTPNNNKIQSDEKVTKTKGASTIEDIRKHLLNDDDNDNEEEIGDAELEEREKFYYLAKLNLKAEHYPQMLDYIEKVITMNPVLSQEERKFFNTAFKTTIAPKRNSWFTVNTLERKEDDIKIKECHREIKGHIEQEIKEICKKIDNLINKYLIPSSPNNENKAYYFTLKGDYIRYLCEITKGEELNKLIEEANKCYEKAHDHCKYINILNSTKLSFALNYAVFLYEIKKSKQKAINFSKSIYEEAVNRIESKKETCDIEKTIPKDSLFIIQLIKENFIFWTGESSDDDSS